MTGQMPEKGFMGLDFGESFNSSIGNTLSSVRTQDCAWPDPAMDNPLCHVSETFLITCNPNSYFSLCKSMWNSTVREKRKFAQATRQRDKDVGSATSQHHCVGNVAAVLGTLVRLDWNRIFEQTDTVTSRVVLVGWQMGGKVVGKVVSVQ